MHVYRYTGPREDVQREAIVAMNAKSKTQGADQEQAANRGKAAWIKGQPSPVDASITAWIHTNDGPTAQQGPRGGAGRDQPPRHNRNSAAAAAALHQ